MNELQKILENLCLYLLELQIFPPGKEIKMSELLKYSLKIVRLYRLLDLKFHIQEKGIKND